MRGLKINFFGDLNKAKLRVFKGDKSKFKVVATILKTLDTGPHDNDFFLKKVLILMRHVM
jgi:hypothetical protein